MDLHGNMARQIRAFVETLGEWADEYTEHGQPAAAEQIEEAREVVGELMRLKDPEGGE
jgi:hypothetical protein